jgi:alkylation response protein AidB-like acyl-CoA dehydrogenase
MAGEAIQAFGGNGYINEYPTGRLWRDAKLYEIGAGTGEIRRMLIGRDCSPRRRDDGMGSLAEGKVAHPTLASSELE